MSIATKACETDAVKSELGNNENKKKLKEEEQAREEARLRERRRDLQNIREKKEWYDNHAAKLGKLGPPPLLESCQL